MINELLVYTLKSSVELLVEEHVRTHIIIDVLCLMCHIMEITRISVEIEFIRQRTVSGNLQSRRAIYTELKLVGCLAWSLGRKQSNTQMTHKEIIL